MFQQTIFDYWRISAHQHGGTGHLVTPKPRPFFSAAELRIASFDGSSGGAQGGGQSLLCRSYSLYSLQCDVL